jgi:hypothetical protein
MEIGMTTFRHVQDENKYEASRYSFYVFPRPFGSIDNKFMCQASSLEFLCQHNFDFNKVRYVMYSEENMSSHYWNYLNLNIEFPPFFTSSVVRND